jgi:hypothetical protein
VGDLVRKIRGKKRPARHSKLSTRTQIGKKTACTPQQIKNAPPNWQALNFTPTDSIHNM